MLHCKPALQFSGAELKCPAVHRLDGPIVSLHMIRPVGISLATNASSDEAYGAAEAPAPAAGELRAAQTPADLLATVESTAPEQMWRALHELRLRQIELEVRNEELRQAQVAAEAARAHYHELYDAAPVGYLLLTDNGITIAQANRRAAALLGAADPQALLRQPLTRFILRDDQERLDLLKKRVVGSVEPQVCELRVIREDKRVSYLQLIAAADVADGINQLRVVLKDLDPPPSAHPIGHNATVGEPTVPKMQDVARRACGLCGLHEACLPAGLNPADLELLLRSVESPRPLAAGQILARSNDVMRNIYVVRAGALKSTIIQENGDRQIIALHLPGELICPGALYQRHYRCEVEALQRSQLCAVRCDRMHELADRVPALQQQFLHMLTRETVHDQDHLVAMGKHTAMHRVVQFLVSLSQRRMRQHLDPHEILLPMTRADIGNFLNLAEETVCRALTRLQHDGVLTLSGKRLQITDHAALMRLCAEQDERTGRSSD